MNYNKGVCATHTQIPRLSPARRSPVGRYEAWGELRPKSPREQSIPTLSVGSKNFCPLGLAPERTTHLLGDRNGFDHPRAVVSYQIYC